MVKLQYYITHYLEYLEEAFSDMAHFLELDLESEVLNGFIITAMILTPIFGTILFLIGSTESGKTSGSWSINSTIVFILQVLLFLIF